MSVTPDTRVAMVRPPVAVVTGGVVPLRAEPDDSSEQVDQALYGERMTELAVRDGWRFVQGRDLYFGWIRAEQLARSAPASPHRLVAVPLAAVRGRMTPDGEVVDQLVVGTRLPHVVTGGWIELAAGRYVDARDTVETAALPDRCPTPDDIVATAESFLGAPYLWGGTSARGIDCSGLTQQVYRLNGVGLDRDADQQALGGRPVDVARPGDLFFFGAERVTHTAIATGEATFIHAPQAGQQVQRGELPADRARLRATRRYLP